MRGGLLVEVSQKSVAAQSVHVHGKHEFAARRFAEVLYIRVRAAVLYVAHAVEYEIDVHFERFTHGVPSEVFGEREHDRHAGAVIHGRLRARAVEIYVVVVLRHVDGRVRVVVVRADDYATAVGLLRIPAQFAHDVLGFEPVAVFGGICEIVDGHGAFAEQSGQAFRQPVGCELFAVVGYGRRRHGRTVGALPVAEKIFERLFHFFRGEQLGFGHGIIGVAAPGQEQRRTQDEHCAQYNYGNLSCHGGHHIMSSLMSE